MRLVSHLSRAIRKLGISNTQFADEAGVARSTIQKLIGRDFKEIRVDTIERIAARLGTNDILELFTLQDDTEDFLAPYTASKSVTFLFGTHDVTDASVAQRERRDGPVRTTIDLWDFRTQTTFLNHVRGHVPEIRDEMEFFSKESFDEAARQHVLELIQKKNVVIVGSPKVNPACEAVLREIYPGSRREPKSPDRGPRYRLAEKGRLGESVIGHSEATETGVIDLRKGKLVAESRYEGVMKSSLDAGIVITLFRPRRTKERVTLVIAAGVSGCGTLGAVQGLVNHPPQAADLDSGVPFEQVFQTSYTKPTSAPRDDRRIDRVELVR